MKGTNVLQVFVFANDATYEALLVARLDTARPPRAHLQTVPQGLTPRCGSVVRADERD